MVLCALMTMSLSAVCAAEEAAVPTAEPQVTVASTTQAQPNQTVADWLAPAAGDWYNTKGDLVLTVEGAAINGSAVTDIEDYTDGYPRKGKFTIREQAGDRVMSLDLMGHKSHQYLIMDNTTPLRRSIHGDHYESIGGVYLGMTQSDLEGLTDRLTALSLIRIRHALSSAVTIWTFTFEPASSLAYGFTTAVI